MHSTITNDTTPTIKDTKNKSSFSFGGIKSIIKTISDPKKAEEKTKAYFEPAITTSTEPAKKEEKETKAYFEQSKTTSAILPAKRTRKKSTKLKESEEQSEDDIADAPEISLTKTQIKALTIPKLVAFINEKTQKPHSDLLTMNRTNLLTMALETVK